MTDLSITPLEAWIGRRLQIPSGQRPTTETLSAAHLAGLRQTVDRVRAHSPFYRRHLAAHPAAGIDHLDAFGRLPFTTAEDLCRDPTAFICVSQADVARVVTLETSGTVRAPKRIFFTEADLERTIDFFHHGMTTLVQPGQRALILLPGERPASVGDLLRRALDRMDVEAIVPGPVINPEALVTRLARKPADAIVGLPLQLLGLARWPARGAVCAPRTVLLTADYVPRAVVAELRRIWACAVFQHYGMTEMGYGGAVECAAMDGYHLREADLYFEIVDPASGRLLPPGETGEVVFTTLNRTGMPLVRYRTGDVARFVPGPCPCGSVLRRMAPVQGRLAHRLRLGQDRFLSLADLDEAVLPLPGVIGLDARIRTDAAGDRLHVAIQVVPGDGPQNLAARAEKALSQIPALAQAMADGSIALASLSVRPAAGDALGRLNKRNLIDQRGVHCP